ncbi:MAG: 4'-phosphopantetheinyl transferase family protein [Mucilaginibacter sp.]
MISTGNDIVALKAINIARTKQVSFYKKIFSVSEKDLYDENLSRKIPFEHFVWLLWSVKESVYKYLQRNVPDLVFSPTRITIGHIEPPVDITVTAFEEQIEARGFNNDFVYKGTVVFGEHVLHSRSIITKDFIFSVVSFDNDFANTYWGIQLISSDDPTYQSAAVRVFLNARLRLLFPVDNLNIGKSKHGYPILLRGTDEISMPVSLAHHGNYVTYSLVIGTI